MKIVWQKRFLSMAKLVSTWSKDPSTKVGAVIVDTQRRIVSTGYNGLPSGVRDTGIRLHNRETKLRCTIHAEENALLFAHRSVLHCTLVTSHHSCASCAAKIIQSGISLVLYGADLDTRWAEDTKLAQEMFTEAQVINYRVGDWVP